ncbi:hypothetical protein CIPAW_03G162200 [Carya illinoinensis]|uniref:Uncharacterized protein n=1 Tax=Carya illinoinensis TaxID=32201 RepID=A0A8T1R454_CARIL|nr:hypothetical protein CIPAW_03G162200 [Carya illinoinensis]
MTTFWWTNVTIQISLWSIIDEVASKPNGLSVLSMTFKTCYPLNSVDVLKNYLVSMYI